MTARTVAQLVSDATDIIDQGFAAGAKIMIPLYSGGHDSGCACHVASHHPKFSGSLHFINTGIGAAENRRHVDGFARETGWRLRVYKSPSTYEMFVRRLGFPGPGAHSWVYDWLKDRCVSIMTRGWRRAMLLTGCRSQESVRRMGHVEPVKVGETSKKTGKVRKKNRVWVAPCHDWSVEEQRAYMDHFDLPTNPVKVKLGMSGECFCGAFASPGERAKIDRLLPDVSAEIGRLSKMAALLGVHSEWGERPPDCKGIVTAETGPLCSSCDLRAQAAGIRFDVSPLPVRKVEMC